MLEAEYVDHARRKCNLFISFERDFLSVEIVEMLTCV